MKLCRFETEGRTRVGLALDNDLILDLTSAGVDHLSQLLESSQLQADLDSLRQRSLPTIHQSTVKFLAPVDQQEVWAAGVTYLRSKKARMEESDFSANAYDRVYEAVRPELFFKSLPQKVVAAGEPIGIRSDAKWNVPEPELALVVNSKRQIAGYTIGNDMSSRDIEGENLLYLPQAKTYHRSCALGPWVVVGSSEEQARQWSIRLEILRQNQLVFAGETSVSKIKRSFAELAEFLFRCQVFKHGAVLLTGTGIVPPDDFTLQANDLVRIDISGIGRLENPVVAV